MALSHNILPRQASPRLTWLSFYSLAGDSMHNMNFSLILIPALGSIVSFKFSLLCITNQNKTLPWPTSPTIAGRVRANTSLTKSIPTNPSWPPFKPPATPAPVKSSPQNNSKSSTPSSANPDHTTTINNTPNTIEGETSGLALSFFTRNYSN